MIKEVAEQQSIERKQFEKKMTQEYKLKKERWKREMAVRTNLKVDMSAVLNIKITIPTLFNDEKEIYILL